MHSGGRGKKQRERERVKAVAGDLCLYLYSIPESISVLCSTKQVQVMKTDEDHYVSFHVLMV